MTDATEGSLVEHIERQIAERAMPEWIANFEKELLELEAEAEATNKKAKYGTKSKDFTTGRYNLARAAKQLWFKHKPAPIVD